MEIPILEIGPRLGLDDLEEIANNFERTRQEVKPPLRLGKKAGTGDPAYGWITALRVASGQLWATISDMPKKIKTAIEQKKYKSLAAEVMSGYKMAGLNIGKVLSSVALLGTGLTSKSLESLKAYLTAEEVGTYSNLICFEQINHERNKKMAEPKIFTSRQEATDDLYERAQKLSFKTGQGFGKCYIHLLEDKSDPAVIYLNDSSEKETALTDQEKAEEELDRIAQRAMLRQDVSYARALAFAMEERPDLASVYVGNGRDE